MARAWQCRPHRGAPRAGTGAHRRRRRRDLHRRRADRWGRQDLDPQAALDAAGLRAGGPGGHPAHAEHGRRGRRRRRTRLSWHDGGDQRRAGRPRRAHGADHHGRVPRRAGAAPPARPAALRPVLRKAAGPHRAPPALRAGRAGHRRRRDPARRAGRRARGHRGGADRGAGGIGRRLPAARLRPPRPRAPGGRVPEPEAAASAGVAVVRHPAGAARVRAHGDHGGQRLRPPDDGRVPAGHAARPGRAGHRRPSPHHAVVRRLGLRGAHRPAAGLHAGVRPRRGRPGRQPDRREARGGQHRHPGHGRHHRQGVDGRGPGA